MSSEFNDGSPPDDEVVDPTFADPVVGPTDGSLAQPVIAEVAGQSNTFDSIAPLSVDPETVDTDEMLRLHGSSLIFDLISHGRSFFFPAMVGLFGAAKGDMTLIIVSLAIFIPSIAFSMEALEAKKSKNDSTKLLSEMLQKNRIELVTAMVGSGLSTNDIENHVECLTGGDSHAGKEIFNTHIEAQCSRCHRVGNKGSTVGPNLKGVASRKPASKDPSYLLRSIVAPSAHIVEKYQTIMLLLDTGETVQGVLVSRDDKEIVLADSNGKELLFENDWIEEESIQKTSIMPIAKTLTKREIRDLVAYLNTLKSKPKSTLKSKK